MSLSLRDRLRTMLELSEHATDDEICQVVGAKQIECDTLVCFRQAVVDAMPLADAQDTDEQLIASVRGLHYIRHEVIGLSLSLRDRLCETLNLNLFGESGKASDDEIMEVLIQALHERDTLRNRLRTALTLPADADDNAIMDELAAHWGERDALARFRQAVVDALPGALASDDNECLLASVRRYIETHTAKLEQSIAQNRRTNRAFALLNAALTTTSSLPSHNQHEYAERILGMVDALESALGRKPQPAPAL